MDSITRQKLGFSLTQSKLDPTSGTCPFIPLMPYIVMGDWAPAWGYPSLENVELVLGPMPLKSMPMKVLGLTAAKGSSPALNSGIVPGDIMFGGIDMAGSMLPAARSAMGSGAVFIGSVLCEGSLIFCNIISITLCALNASIDESAMVTQMPFVCSSFSIMLFLSSSEYRHELAAGVDCWRARLS